MGAVMSPESMTDSKEWRRKMCQETETVYKKGFYWCKTPDGLIGTNRCDKCRYKWKED